MNSTEKKLADLVREHPHLYDPSRRDYKDNLKGHVSWKEIAGAMGKSEEEVKQKWKNLRDKFCKAKKRLVKRRFPPRDEDGDGGEAELERHVPVLYHQLAWLTLYVKPRAEKDTEEPEEVTGSADDVEKDEKLQHCSPPVVTTSVSVLECRQTRHQDVSVSHKRKRQTTAETEICSAETIRDEDELFLLSLLPSMKRLTIKKRMEVRMKFQQVLYAAEFEH